MTECTKRTYLLGLVVQVGAAGGWDWNMKFWEEAYNSAAKTIAHVSFVRWGLVPLTTIPRQLLLLLTSL